MPILGNVIPPTIDLKGTELILDADADTTITADTDDTIDIRIAGADDFQFTANKFLVQTGSVIDVNGTELILDADADTSITADTDDTIDFKIAGADDFRMTANTLSVLSGSTLNVDSGATIANSGTATGFGGAASGAMAMEVAFAGVLQANANFVDQVIFGPAVDGQSWNGFWDKAGVYSSLMLATIEDEGSNTEINIWDLTQEQSAGVITTTPLATVDLANAATPTSIAASMGYLIVGSEDGIAIIDPHSGAWAERTVGWPKSLTASTVPALTNASVIDVDAGLANQPPLDPRTGGPMPTFVIAYDVGADIGSILKDDGNVYDRAGTVTAGQGAAAIVNSKILLRDNAGGGRIDVSRVPVGLITADDWGFGDVGGSTTGEVPGLGFDDTISGRVTGQGVLVAGGSDAGLTILLGLEQADGNRANQVGSSVTITRVFNSGHMLTFSKGAWLANSSTVDRSVQANTLTNNGSAVTSGVVASGAELLGYSAFTADNNLTVASNADWDVITTGLVCLSGWFKSSGNDATEDLFGFGKADDAITYFVRLNSSGTITGFDRGATGADRTVSSTQTYDDGVWHKIDFIRISSTKRYLYIDGIEVDSDGSDAGSLSSSGNLPFAIGVNYDGSSVPATSSTIALVRLSVFNDANNLALPGATQIREMYDAEKGMFVANAECLLQSGSTDAVLDVDVDPLSGKVIVTQTDAITIFDGLVIDSKPTVNSGASEKGKLWGDLRAEQNAVNAYVTAPATDQRQVNEMVRSLASDLPAGVDMSKAKAWCITNSDSSIEASYNIKSVTDGGTGDYFYNFAVPFKTPNYVCVANSGHTTAGTGGGVICGINGGVSVVNGGQQLGVRIYVTNSSAGARDDPVSVVMFGELENE